VSLCVFIAPLPAIRNYFQTVNEDTAASLYGGSIFWKQKNIRKNIIIEEND
jgi:hypothetical protein